MLGCWCISTVTVEPAFTAHFAAALEEPALQAMSVERTFVTGELLAGSLAHWAPFTEVSLGICRIQETGRLI